jgi:glyoxylase-like metal-dependent hydrolase (beta-lactamase superfamily II)
LRQEFAKLIESDLPHRTPLVDGKLRLSVNAFALDDGRSVTLIDTGASNAWLPSMGALPQALGQAKIAPERIRTVAFTHTHIDHINGLILPNGRDAFPDMSRLLVPKAELELFRAEARLERFHARAAPFEPSERLDANIEALDAAGHEIGHTCFRVTSGGETILVWGDIVHVPSLQFDKPDIAWEFDADQDQARATRLRILALAADSGATVAGAHLDSPGVGRVSRAGESFRFDPL